MNTLSLRDWPTLRQWIQVVGASVLGALVAYNVIGTTTAGAIAAFVVAILPNALSALNSATGFRAWFYGLVGALQALLIALDVFTAAQVSPIANIVFAILTAGVSVTHTPTPDAAEPTGRHAAR